MGVALITSTSVSYTHLVKELNSGKTPVHEPIYFKGEVDRVEVEAAIQFVDTFEENILGFCNNIFTQEGGTHLAGFKTRFTAMINSYAREPVSYTHLFLVGVRRLKEHREKEMSSWVLKECLEVLKLRERLPYALTGAQERTLKEVFSDMAGGDVYKRQSLCRSDPQPDGRVKREKGHFAKKEERGCVCGIICIWDKMQTGPERGS